MAKTIMMVLGLAAFMGASTACFGLFSRDEPAVDSCEGLVGQARIDCENRKAAPAR